MDKVFFIIYLFNLIFLIQQPQFNLIQNCDVIRNASYFHQAKKAWTHLADLDQRCEIQVH